MKNSESQRRHSRESGNPVSRVHPDPETEQICTWAQPQSNAGGPSMLRVPQHEREVAFSLAAEDLFGRSHRCLAHSRLLGSREPALVKTGAGMTAFSLLPDLRFEESARHEEARRHARQAEAKCQR